MDVLVSSSFSKNFGLYGERVGALHIISHDKKNVSHVSSQFSAISRTLYSNCPSYGVRIVSIILSDDVLKEQWKQELFSMTERMNNARLKLFESLQRYKVKGNWEHIVKQRGMFSYLG